jgi:hypothetical protein
MPTERRLSLVASHGLRFQKDWDSHIIEDYESIPGNAFLYCGAALDSDMKPAYTAVESFKKSPIVVARPLLRQAGPMRAIWCDWPMLMKTTDASRLVGQTFEEAALRLTHLSGQPIFTTSKAVAWRQNSWTHVDSYESFANDFFHAADRLLGTVRDIASASEIITKYGSLSNYSWLHSTLI